MDQDRLLDAFAAREEARAAADKAIAAGVAAAVANREIRADSMYNDLTGLGSSSDKGEASRPNPYIVPLTPAEMTILYENNATARRVIDIIPERGTRRGWLVTGIDAKAERDLATAEKFFLAASYARAYGGGALLPITAEDTGRRRGRPRSKLSLFEPLDLARIGQITAVHVLDGLECWPSRWDNDLTSPTWRQPTHYQINVSGAVAEVHASRMIVFHGVPRAPHRWRLGLWPAVPVTQLYWDELRRLGDTLQGGAILAAELREGVLKLGSLGAGLTGLAASDIESRLAALQRGRGLLGLSVIGPDDVFESRSNPPTGFDTLVSAAWEAVAAATGIPQIILMGSSPGGLNTDGASAWEGFRQLVSGWQERDLRPKLERFYEMVYASQDGPTGGEIPADWELRFHTLDEPDQSTTSETRLNTAKMDEVYIAAGVYSAADVARSRFGPTGYSFDLDEEIDPDGVEPPDAPLGAPDAPPDTPDTPPDTPDTPPAIP